MIIHMFGDMGDDRNNGHEEPCPYYHNDIKARLF